MILIWAGRAPGETENIIIWHFLTRKCGLGVGGWVREGLEEAEKRYYIHPRRTNYVDK